MRPSPSTDTAEKLPGQNSKNRWFVFAKLVFGSALLIALVLKADVQTIAQHLRSVNWYFILMLFVLPHLLILISAWKWQIFLREVHLSLPLGRLFRLYMIATFFNNFLPTMLGGDAVRVYTLGREMKALPAVTAATVMERLIGFAGLVLLLPLVLFFPIVTERFPILWYAIPAVALGFAVAAWIALTSDWLRLTRPLRNVRFVGWVIKVLSEIQDSIRLAAKSAGVLVATFAISVVFYIGAAACVWAASRSLGIDVGIVYLVATAPLVLLVAMLPISLNGLGIVEGGYALFLSLVGVPLAEAVGVGLLLRARILITGMLGGLIFLGYRADQRRGKHRNG